jgi:Holliday junction resolvase RusA-like endonuclease
VTAVREFFVPGRPSPKARARTTKTGHTFTPKPTQLAEGKVLECYLAANPDAESLEGPVSVYVGIFFAIPASWSRKKREEARYHTGRPDADNILKLVTDALNGVAFADDSQVCDIRVTKRYVTGDWNEGMVVTVKTLEA